MGTAKLNNKSKGERVVEKALIKLRVPFYRETCVKGCKGSAKSLPFDFSIVIGGEIVALIEYQGVQHSVPSFGWDDYLKTLETDEIKRKFCKENNIPLLILPFNKFKELDTLIYKFLRETGIMKKIRLSRVS